jgi:hypothetical protein
VHCVSHFQSLFTNLNCSQLFGHIAQVHAQFGLVSLFLKCAYSFVFIEVISIGRFL